MSEGTEQFSESTLKKFVEIIDQILSCLIKQKLYTLKLNLQIHNIIHILHEDRVQ
jgi:hypothetical protein